MSKTKLPEKLKVDYMDLYKQSQLITKNMNEEQKVKFLKLFFIIAKIKKNRLLLNRKTF